MNCVKYCTAMTLAACASCVVDAGDWTRFRGPGGQGIAESSSKIPEAWSADANLSWKTELPGPGASSPIVVGKQIFVTCYSGYGLSKEEPGELKNLVRHLVSIDSANGKIQWQKDVPVSLPEDSYTGIGVTAHGYASHTPVTDGKNVYAFFGKSGVHAFDVNGKKLWQADVGKESDPAEWGSSSSPIIYKNLVIVTAAAESQSIIAFDSTTGEVKWKQEAKGLDNMWGTPTLVKTPDGGTEMVMCVAREIWGMDPATGDLKWFAKATDAEQSYASVVTEGHRIFAVTGRGGGTVAIDAGGSGDISESNTVWEGKDSGSFASPVAHGSKLYSIARGIVTVVDMKSGERLKQLRLRGATQTGGRFGSLDYASPIVVGDRLYYLNGSGQMFVFDVSGEIKQVAVNSVTSEKETFWGTPAVTNEKLIFRSSGHLYCVADKGETVTPDETLVASAEQPEDQDENAGREGRGGRGGPGAGRGGPGAGRGRPGAGGGRPGGAGGGRFDPMSMFNGMDKDKDGKVTEEELEGNRMAERLMTLDKDSDKAISSEEFRTGVAGLFRQGGGRPGAGRGGRGGGGDDKRPDRPQRPKMANK